MPDVPIKSVGRIVMTWIWNFSCDLSMKKILKFVWLIFVFFLALLGFTFKCRSGNPASRPGLVQRFGRVSQHHIRKTRYSSRNNISRKTTCVLPRNHK